MKNMEQQQPAKKIETSIENAIENLRLLMISPDKNKLEAIVADELHYGHSDGDLEDKATFIGSLLSKKSDFLSIALSKQTINLHANIAVVRHVLKAATYDDKINRNINLMILSIWNLQNNSWKIIARQAVKIH